MGQLTRGALSSSCTLLFIPPLPHTTHSHTHRDIDTLTYMHTVGITLCWHFILSFTIVQPWTRENYRDYMQQCSRAHCSLKCGQAEKKKKKKKKWSLHLQGKVFFFLFQALTVTHRDAAISSNGVQ